MDLQNLNFKAKDIITFLLYIVPATFFVATINAKVDKATDEIVQMQNDKRESNGENKTSNFITQNDIKALTIRAELNRQNIEIIKNDIEILKTEYRNRNDR